MKLKTFSIMILMLPTSTVFAMSTTIACENSISCTDGVCSYPNGWESYIDINWNKNANGIYTLQSIFFQDADPTIEQQGFILCDYSPPRQSKIQIQSTISDKYANPIRANPNEWVQSNANGYLECSTLPSETENTRCAIKVTD